MDLSTTPADEPSTKTATPRWRHWARHLATVLSALLGLGLVIVYLGRPDACAAVTVFPPWAWVVPGLLLGILGSRRRGCRAAVLLIVAWCFYLLILTEEPWSLARSLIRLGPAASAARPGEEVLRVISLNCAIGNRLAADEVIVHRPDVVLLQESPNRGEVESLARRLFGTTEGVVHGVDASMIVNGRAVAADLGPRQRGYFVQARVRLKSGREIEVISTRLLPALFRVDLWSPDCWREQAENRRARREQLRVIARRVDSATVPVIVGGDFNAPQGDAVFRLFRPKLQDAFREAGRGWGDTIINEFAALRIDQIWVGEEFRPHAVVARKTVHSDHRMVICDLIVVDQSPQGR